ncbi:hypothetical protein [Laspinema palackyanum]
MNRFSFILPPQRPTISTLVSKPPSVSGGLLGCAAIAWSFMVLP